MIIPIGEHSTVQNVLDVLDKSTKIVALLLGGGWAYFKFVRGRTFKSRLEPKVSAAVFGVDGRSFLRGTIQLKNVGISQVPIEQKGTAIVISTVSAPAGAKLKEDEIRVLEVFKQHGWIESGELIEEPFLLELPKTKAGQAAVAVRVAVRVVSNRIEWNAEAIVPSTSEQQTARDNKTGEQKSASTETITA